MLNYDTVKSAYTKAGVTLENVVFIYEAVPFRIDENGVYYPGGKMTMPHEHYEQYLDEVFALVTWFGWPNDFSYEE